jgi:ubiquinone/menaquinone biosynthesis C-methylase UbiE
VHVCTLVLALNSFPVSPIIFKVSTYVEAYRIRARFSKDFHQLDGRWAYRELTTFINRQISQHVDLRATDTLIDIGCGDGCLLNVAKEIGVKTAIGFSASEEEAERLRAQGLDVRQGLTKALPVDESIASVVVCNAVFLIVPHADIPQSLKEIARVAAPGARVFLGEIPFVPELNDVPLHKSLPAMLWYLLRRRGPRTFLGMCRKLLLARFKGEPFIMNSSPTVAFFATPQEFVEMAADAGLTLVRHFPHQLLSPEGKVIQSDTRCDYLFTKRG